MCTQTQTKVVIQSDDTGVAYDIGVAYDTGVADDTGVTDDTGVADDRGVADDTWVTCHIWHTSRVAITQVWVKIMQYSQDLKYFKYDMIYDTWSTYVTGVTYYTWIPHDTYDTAVGFQSIRAESRLEACMTHKSHMLQQSCMALA